MPYTEYVGTGSLSVRGPQDVILVALLASCVGVAVVDRTARVGGLFHVPLPEPIGSGNPWQPESYASTGLPLFLDTLCKAGAQKKRMEAFVAGGALLGKALEHNLDLDLGGQTADVVMDILNRESIRIRQSETGGLYNMRLSLDLNTWECTIKPFILYPPILKGQVEKPTAEEINLAIARVQPIPQVAIKIVRMIGNNRYSLQDVAAEVRQDQIIAAKVLRLCNSAFIGCDSHIDSVDHGLVILGERMFLLLVMSSFMEVLFAESGRGYSLCKGSLYHHTVGTALVAEKLARITGLATPAVAYTAGLMHDIGKVVLDRFVTGNVPLFYRRTQEEIIDLEQAEIEILGIGHTEAGVRLARLWSIPQNLTEAIQYHHQPEKAIIDPELTNIVYLADFILSHFWVSGALERQNTGSLAACLKRLGISFSQMSNIVDSISWTALNSLRPPCSDLL
ncbi:MAG: HDOD domain-containing protein [Nitrospirae bacterium]|nr:HDOD domain-containing protein [Nitrospirota bacterium]